MKSHMSFQVMISCKSLITYFALKWLFTGMRTLMVLKYMLITKTAVAYLASKYFVTTVICWETTPAAFG